MIVRIIFFIVTTVSLIVNAQWSCNDAPTRHARIVCEQLHRWDTRSRENARDRRGRIAHAPGSPPPPPPGVGGAVAAPPPPPAAIAASPYQCLNFGCLCPYFKGTAAPDGASCALANGQRLTKAVRKEYRMLSDDERNRFHGAVRQLKTNGEYDRLGKIHSDMSMAGGAHSGPAFLPWHREFTKRFEIALRQADPNLALPYWDSTLDQRLANPADSILFSEMFAGTTDAAGMVTTGPFNDFKTMSGRAHIFREIGKSPETPLLSEENIQYVMGQSDVDKVLAYSTPQPACQIQPDWNCLEATHGNVHVYIGGDMVEQATSSNDPLFYLHHSFVDHIWELWRQSKQPQNEREIAYPLDNQLCASTMHFGSAEMMPFSPLRNVDGLSNAYTANLFEYAPRPTCSVNSECGSNYLFCDRTHGVPRCVAKIRIGSNCAAYTNGENPCYNGECQAGRCVLGSKPKPPPVTPRPYIEPATVIAPVQLNNCFNENQCCAKWATEGECQKNPNYMKDWCKASCGDCKPSYDINIECSDRHLNCKTWASKSQCQENEAWMTENCRQSCNRCGVTRAQECAAGNKVTLTSVTTMAPPTCSNAGGCYNDFLCCGMWGMQGECTTNATFMACNCRVSCGQCVPTDYDYGSCNDYHKECAKWSNSGECQKNPWMLENCRASCNTCLKRGELRRLCDLVSGKDDGGGGGGGGGGQWGGGGGHRGGGEWHGRRGHGWHRRHWWNERRFAA